MALQYFTGKKTSSFVHVTDPDLPMGYVELEMRMCAHCGFHGAYAPGKMKEYAKYFGKRNYIAGICCGCMGMTCLRAECNAKCMVLEERLDLYEKGKLAHF